MDTGSATSTSDHAKPLGLRSVPACQVSRGKVNEEARPRHSEACRGAGGANTAAALGMSCGRQLPSRDPRARARARQRYARARLAGTRRKCTGTELSSARELSLALFTPVHLCTPLLVSVAGRRMSDSPCRAACSRRTRNRQSCAKHGPRMARPRRS